MTAAFVVPPLGGLSWSRGTCRVRETHQRTGPKLRVQARFYVSSLRER